MYADVEDPLLGIDLSLTLEPNTYWEEDFEYTVTANTPDPLVNTVYVHAWDYQLHNLWATALWTIEIYHPMIEITKTADRVRRGRRTVTTRLR
jgi:hypothetical protein